MILRYYKHRTYHILVEALLIKYAAVWREGSSSPGQATIQINQRSLHGRYEEPAAHCAEHRSTETEDARRQPIHAIAERRENYGLQESYRAR